MVERSNEGVTVLGVDGGGTATRVAIVDGRGALLGAGRADSGNLHVAGRDGVKLHLQRAVEEACARARRDRRPFDAVFLGMAGCSGPREAEALAGIAVDLGLAAPGALHVDHDLRIALAGALAGGPGIVVVAGTGSAAFGRDAQGRAWRAGGLGPIFDDAGSAWDLGRRALIATLRAADGRAQPDALTRAIEAATGAAGPRGCVAAAERHRGGRAAVAALAPCVFGLAERGDEHALRLVREAGVELAALAAAVGTRARLTGADVSLVGGAAAAPSLRRAFQTALGTALPGARSVAPRLAPCLGAALLALDSLGLADRPAYLEQLAAARL